MRALAFAAVLLAAFAAPVSAQTPPVPTTQAEAPRTILFIGNSFTEGANSAVLRYRTDSVTHLNGDRIGGIPALFARFAGQKGLNWRVAMHTHGGWTLAQHLRERADRFAKAWDAVVLQEYSTLSPERPGDASGYGAAVRDMAILFTKHNPAVDLYLMASWSRADQIYRVDGPWRGTPIGRMASDLRVAADQVAATNPAVDGVIPVGEAWTRAMEAGVADPNPYDGTSYGQIDLWSYDHYHASAAGSYLQALTIFGRITGIDPRSLGRGEAAAEEIGLSQDQAAALQRIAAETLGLAG
ncbi:PEP-CTERM sorting domain-containing protein [Sphingomonas aestuarii]